MLLYVEKCRDFTKRQLEKVLTRLKENIDQCDATKLRYRANLIRKKYEKFNIVPDCINHDKELSMKF